MYLIVFFDLPVMDKKQRKNAACFRRFLLKDGFLMLQKSVYVRFCNNRDATEKHQKRIQKNLPEEGTVFIQSLTDNQYKSILKFEDKQTMKIPVCECTEYGIEVL